MHQIHAGILAASPLGAGSAGPGGPAGPQAGGNMLVSLFPFILIFVVFYFLIIAPQRKQQKELQAMLSAIKRGDKVVTTGGLHGTVADFKESEKVVVLQVAQNVRVDVSRSAIASVTREGAGSGVKPA